MRAVVQRVASASVSVGGREVSAVGRGLMILLAVKTGDTEQDARWMAGKCAELRIFEDDDGKLNRSVRDAGGSALVVSQFTLYGDCSKGRRPSFSSAAAPERAREVFETFCALLAETGIEVRTGVFGEKMQVSLVNDGPVTLVIDREPRGAVTAPPGGPAAGSGILRLPREKLVLASGSPRRRELLEMIGLDFELVVPDVHEESLHENEPSRFVTEIALAKAQSVSSGVREALVLGADTIVVLGGRILGKPRDESDAAEMLRALSGRTHEVYTGMALVDAQTGIAKTGFERSEVTMKRLTEEEITRYVATREPADKAGSYGIQGLGAVFIQHIKGCYFNVMGLPVAKFYQMLEELSLELEARRGGKEAS